MNDAFPRTSLLQRLHQEVRDYLHLSAEIIEAPLRPLEAGEEFTVLFQVHNRFGVYGEIGGPALYQNVVLWLEPTEFAEPLPEAYQEFLLVDNLGAGRSITRAVRFRARSRLGNVVFLELPEPFVRARVEADFDVQGFFHVVQEQGFIPETAEPSPRSRRRIGPSLFTPRRQQS